MANLHIITDRWQMNILISEEQLAMANLQKNSPCASGVFNCKSSKDAKMGTAIKHDRTVNELKKCCDCETMKTQSQSPILNLTIMQVKSSGVVR